MKATTKQENGLADIVIGMRGCAVLVAGDIMLDRFVYGEATRISPESPVPVLSIRDEAMMLGGAGNVLSNLSGLGVQAHILSVVGDDDAARTVRALAQDKGIDPAGLLVSPDRPTTMKTRFLAAHQQLLRADYERSAAIPATVESALLAQAEKLLPKMQALVLSDYGKGVLTQTVITGLIAAAKKANVPVLVDPKGADYSIYRGASAVTPNRKELAEATNGHATKSDADIVEAATLLMQQAGIEAVVATRSQDGMSIVARNEAPVHLRTEALEVFDVSGAGDTVIATVAAALAAGADLVDAARIANSAAGLVVAKVGTAAVRHAELLDVLSHNEHAAHHGAAGSVVIDSARNARLCNRDEAAEIAQRWKARGLRVGFTNGCFDILHPGHVSYLNQARNRCDRLIVALNADESVRRLKGPARPVNDENARATVIGALGSVDMVVLFGTEAADDDKPVRLIEKLKPSIFFKGGDYTEEQLPEAKVVRAYGGEVELMPHYEGHSTTGTIKKITAA